MMLFLLFQMMIGNLTFFRKTDTLHLKYDLLKSRKNFAQMLNEGKRSAMIIIILGKKPWKNGGR